MIKPDFILAGNAIFTIQNPAGERYTFKIVKKPASDRFKLTYFVKLLTGSDNTNDYTYLGLLNPVSLVAYPTKASKIQSNALVFKVLDWVLKLIREGKNVPDGYVCCHEGRCGRCGRLLTVPESVASGIGPECARKM